MREIEQIEIKDVPTKETCPGLVFRCSHSQFSYRDRKNRIVWGEKTMMRLLIKESCEGCRHCGYLEDELHEFSCERSADIRPGIEHGAKYRLTIVDIERDWESGMVDGWGLAFIKIEE